MDIDQKIDRAVQILQKAYERQRAGDLQEAIRLYKASIEEHPTAEAHTYLGWTYSFQGRFDEAIEQCKIAITVDPQFGNPYNDIGSPRYEPRHFPYLNLFRVYLKLGQLDAAQREFEQARFIQQTLEIAAGAGDEESGAQVH